MKQLLIMGIIVLALLGLTACNSEIGTDQAQSEQTAVETAGDMSPAGADGVHQRGAGGILCSL